MEVRTKAASVLSVLHITLALIITKEVNSVLSVLALIMDSRGEADSVSSALAIIMEVREATIVRKKAASASVLPTIIRMQNIA